MSYLYILETIKGYYIGITNNLEHRLKRHKNGLVKSTKGRLPIKLVYKEFFITKSEAQKKEYRLKSWKSKKLIERVIKTAPSSSG